MLHIRVIDGEGAIHPAGSKDGRGVSVQITDETGKPVEAATVSFRLPEEGPGGTFSRGMKTEVLTTDTEGRAAVHGIAWNRVPGAFQVRVTAIKGQVRAGTLVSKYVSDAAQVKSARGPSRKKWIAVAALVGAGAAVGLAAGMGGGSSSSTPAAPPPSPPPTIGQPTISIGQP